MIEWFWLITVQKGSSLSGLTNGTFSGTTTAPERSLVFAHAVKEVDRNLGELNDYSVTFWSCEQNRVIP